MFPKPFYRHLAPALLAGLGLRLFFISHFPFASGDTHYYEELARNWLYHGVYGLYSHGQLVPSDLRAPGYPAFLALIYFFAGPGRSAVMIAQALVDLATCVLAAGIAVRLAADASERDRCRVAIAALWLTALCPFTANYTAVVLTEALATFLTILAIFIFLAPDVSAMDASINKQTVLRSTKTLFFGGLIVGLGTLVRPETPLLAISVLLVLFIRFRRPAKWEKLALATLWIAAGLLIPLTPWAARNAMHLGRTQFLAPRYAETYGDTLPTGFYAWTKTWMYRFRDAYLFIWKLPAQDIDLNDLPAYATDSHEERARVISLLNEYNRIHSITLSMDQQFAALARDRARRHPFRTYLCIPIERAAAMWFTPRVELLPYSGRLWPLGQSHHNNPVDFDVTLGFAVLNVLYLAMALVAIRHARTSPGIFLILTFLAVRTAFLTQLQTCEPRYVLVCYPALLALAAQIFRHSSPSSPRTGVRRIAAAS